MAGPALGADLRALMTERLHRAGQRVTANRETLVAVLAAAGRPLTIPEVIEAAGTLAQSSAYRNLQALEQAGLVHRIVTNDDFARYELAEDLTEHHHHLICRSCGTVEDVPAAPGLERSVRAAADAIARDTGFHTQHHRVDLLGLCRRCA